ncbi:PTS glucose transporter subunit IIB [Mycoplasma flocculare]|uniref:PTS transporter subunit IIB n=2 Tax=Mesomycoplasma flocculare TaxID=2128 RepID=A0A0A8E908_MESFC|nr:PTS transporter subunit EIIB [Mesomycoplasma flocculare]AJC50062.1 PTS transporter subunit IIB [Mesomycoplasma flocculare ATCC 27399]ENX51027.1 PTS system glucose-specific enzyme IIB component [Mesomycoplasma flocculare ATCC 27716]MXR05942.1 PTS glucose transporter subunit IIB [Mesomycoplasma flocculare]MXR12410.1 PTS glucose transporter subunit IIB [Mesomycoplasma flocculare]MXR13565.1 PTS glucose transporter subunit IIB [Mesomycoplasma flocculare]
MKLISKIIYLLLQIFSFGFFAKYIKKKHNKINSDFIYEKKFDFKIEELVNLLGGKVNIEKSDFTISRLRIKLKSTENLDFEKIKKLKGISGIFVSSDMLNLIVGNKSKAIWKAINNFE